MDPKLLKQYFYQTIVSVITVLKNFDLKKKIVRTIVILTKVYSFFQWPHD